MVKIKLNRIFLNIIFLLISIYIYLDFNSSTNSGLRNMDRSKVHYILFALILLLMLNFIFNLFKKKKLYIDDFAIGLLIITVYILFVNLFIGKRVWALAIQVGLSLLWFLLYIYVTNLTNLTKKSNTTTIYFFMTMFCMFYIYAAIYSTLFISSTYERYAVVNMAYYSLVFLPFVLTIKKSNIKKILLASIIIVVLFSSKRGVIITLPLMIAMYNYVNSIILGKKLLTLFKTMGILFLFLILLYFVDLHYLNGFILSRFTKEQLSSGSGRIDSYKFVINEFTTRNLKGLLFGYGSGSSVDYLGTGVHNEWLEFLFSFGFFGVLLYFNLIVKLVKKIKKGLKEKERYAANISMLAVYFIIVGMFGGIYFVHSTMFVIIQLALYDKLKN